MRPFGTDAQGQEVHALDLAAGDLSATILTRGAILHEVRLGGVDRNLTVGCERLSDHDGFMIYHGALVAPVANRIKGARAVIAGRVPGRSSPAEITLCDLTGTGVQDTAIALLSYRRARASGVGVSFETRSITGEPA